MCSTTTTVALRKESVDRNGIAGAYPADGSGVALRKESVDRNFGPKFPMSVAQQVALRKESVDRNSCWLLA